LNTEKYLTVSLKGKGFTINFKDSMQFMASSLDNLVSTLVKSSNPFKYMNMVFSSDKAKMLLRKGVFPYDWYNEACKLDFNSLPPIEAFYSKLGKKHISKEDYEYAQLIWKEFNCKTFKDYMLLYLRCDVIQLADVFESFRDLCLDKNTGYELDPCHYFTSPGMFWDGALKQSKVKLTLLTELDMVLMFEKGMRGGISMISHRHAVANTEVNPEYDPSKPKSNIIYLDANNLYGYAMSKYLPTGGFEWIEPSEFGKSEEEQTKAILNLKDDSKKGFIFMVDVEYPQELHDLHNDYPLLPEKMMITKKMASPYNQELSQATDHPLTDCVKLVPNLQDKENYVVHYTLLRQAIELGMRVKKIHKIIAFNQSPWLKSYIDFNTNQRIVAKKEKNGFLADFYKLANNSVFGKTMENVRNRASLKLVTSFPWEEVKKDGCMSAKRKLLRRLANPMVENVTIFDENMICIHSHKTEVILNKPIYVGMAILDISKTLMYDFHYNTMMKQYNPEKCRLLFTDTDSLCYHIKTDDVYQDMTHNKEVYDFSEYPIDHILHDKKNSAVIGKFKDETAGIPIIEFAGLKPKMYGIRTIFKKDEIGGVHIKIKDDERIEFKILNPESIKAKGVSKTVTKNEIHMSDFNDVREKDFILKKSIHAIRSYKHQIYSISQNKIALSAIDTKRYIKDDGISSFAYGHYKIEELQIQL
jgi:hypothetical protein